MRYWLILIHALNSIITCIKFNLWISISFPLASSAYLSHLLLSTSIYWKLGEAWTIAYYVFIIIVFNVDVTATVWLLVQIFLIWVNVTAILTSVLDSYFFTKTAINFTAELILWSWKLFLWWCSVSCTFLAAWLIACLDAWLVVLTIGISFIKFRVGLLWHVLLAILFPATFFHLVIITVLILIESLFEGQFSFSLQMSDFIFIK